MKKFIVLLVFLSLAGCGGNVFNKGCNTLTDVSQQLDKIYAQAQRIHLEDPNLVSLRDLETINKILKTIDSAKDVTCKAKDIRILNK